MRYNIIGLMSGSSLDGLDVAFVSLEESNGRWNYEWIATDCIEYSEEWLGLLKKAKDLSIPDFLRLHTAYGHYTGNLVSEFIEEHSEHHPVDLIASHGHTIFHDPAAATTFQLGDGAAIAAETGLPVVSDLRNMDVAFGGQGAPIVPLGEQLLFPDYDCWLNLGGIANITSIENGEWKAFDVCACNQVLNALAAESGKVYDYGGNMAASGNTYQSLLEALNALDYFSRTAPKSLDNAFSQQEIMPLLQAASISTNDKLRTAVEHIAFQIGNCLPPTGKPGRLLVTGGGALNEFLVERLKALLLAKRVTLVVPDIRTVQYKEALIMALLGALRLQGKPTVLNSVTGAKESSIGGAIWMPVAPARG